MVDGAATLMTFFHGYRAMGIWNDERGTNLLDTGAHFYDVYQTSDGGFISLGSIEPQFYMELRERLELDGDEWDDQMSRSGWPALKEKLAAIVATKSRDEWCEILEGTDVCFAPVLSMAEAPSHPHNVARGTFTEIAGVVQPRPAPRFSRSDSSIERPPPHAGQHTDEILAEIGLDADAIEEMRESGAVA
jgi:alpha-methylacyl-CoA racemase